MLPWIELQQIKAYWLQHHAISHTQLHLLFFFFFDKSEKRNIISTTWKLLYVILFTVFVKDFIFHPLGSSLSLRILFQLTSHLFYSGFLGYHEHISVKCLPTKMTTFSSHCGLLSLLILPEVLPYLTSEINSRSLSRLEKLRQGKHGDSKLCKTGREL